MQIFYQQPLGRELARLESEQLQRTLGKLFAPRALQLGNSKLIAPHQFKHFVVMDPLHTNYTQLPFRDDSFELVLLPHILEFEMDSTAVIEEAWRVLAPNGHLVILGFNPWSLWGIRHLCASRWSGIPWHGHFYSAEKLQWRLRQMEAEIVTYKSFFHRPPIAHATFLTQTRWLEPIVRLLLPSCGGVYLIMAKKCIIPLTPIVPRWRWQTLLAYEKNC